MAFYTEERLNENRVLTDADFNVGFTDYLGATISDAWHDNPTVATIELGEVYTAQVGRDALADLMGDSFDTETDVSEFEPAASPALSLEDQQARIKEAGLEKHIKAQEGYNAEALDLIMEGKREELQRQITRQAASDWYAPAGFIAGLGTSMLDPINIASNFIPGVGQTRALRMLQEGAKQGAKGLALRRAVIGAAEGAAGSVAVEPLVALARSQQQADYGMTDSLLNVAFGTVMGATLHPAIGAWGDYKRKQAQKNNPLITAPWETVAPTDRTEELRDQLAQDAYARAQEAGSDMTEEQAYAAAAMFDARARTWAYFEKADPEAYYERWAPSFRAEAAGDGFIPPDLADGIGQDLDPASRPDAPVQDSPAEAPTPMAEPVIQTVPGRWRGASVSVLTPQGEDRGYYELRELSDIVASHDPDADFARRADYPEGAQERPYHSDQNEKDKVFRNAMTLDPRYLVNDNPDAVNGPPVITESGVVLGGNSRTMSIQLAYGRYADRAELYKQALRDKAALFGIDASAVDSMTAPVLVRVVEGVDTPEAMALRSRLYNQSMTQGINRGAEGVSRGRLVSPDSIDILARGMEEGETLRAWLDTADGKRFVQSLIKDGVLEQTQLGRLLDEKGALTDEGKALVEKTLRGLIVPDADLLRITPPSVLNKLDAIVPAMLRLKARGEGWDISKHLAEALTSIAEAQNMDVGLNILFGQGSLLDEQGAKPAVQAIAYTLKNATPTETKLRFNLFAEAAYKAEKGQGMLLASDVTPANSFIRSFLGSVAKVGATGIAGFNPSARIRDSAILYAWENGGRGHSVETATQRLAEAMRKGEVEEELKDSARAIMGQLAQMEGSVQVFGPKMGERFRYDGGELWQGMYRNKADMRTFIQNTMAGMYGKKTFIGIGELSNEAFPGYELQMTDDTVRHVLREEHAGFDDWESVVDVVNTGEAEALDASTRVTGNKVTVYAKKYGDRVQVALVSPRSEKRRELMLLTTFNTTEKGYAQWMEGIKKDPSQTDAYILTGRGGESPQGLPTGYEGSFSGINIPQTGEDINTLLQRAWHGTPHDFDAFTLQAIQILDKLYQIIGEKGAARLDRAREETVRTDNLAVAVKMAAEGKDDITIRLATGWEQGVDGKWRYEIPDGRLDFSGLKGKVQRGRYTPKGAHRAARLKDVLIMPDLYAAYPEIANIRVFTQTLPRQEHAAVQMYSDGTKVIVLNSRYAKPGKPTEAILSNIVHEVQHVIQSAEGFIQGSNPKKAGGFERYKEVAGEAEARNAESRMGFSEEDRRNFPLSSTSDVPAESMRTPDGKPLRDPRLPVEPVGPLIGREPRHALPEELPDDYDLGMPPEQPVDETPRGSVTFRPEDGKAVITFFKNTDASTLPHEMFHIFRRELAETAGVEGSSPQSKDMWAKVCEFVGAKDGEPWTREQEEMFARAGERYLLEGKAPNAQLRGVFERMRQWFMEIYTSMDAAGMEISDTMRQVFGDMFKLSPEEADMAFRYGFGRMLEWDGSEGTDTAIPELPESDDPAMQEELTGLAAQRLEESLQSVADRPEIADAVRAQVEQEIAELDAEMAQTRVQGEVLMDAALCDMRN